MKGNFVLCSIGNGVTFKLAALPPTAQQILKPQQYKLTKVIIDGQTTYVLPLGVTETTCNSDVIYCNPDGNLVTMKR
jgi:hypothetical protein